MAHSGPYMPWPSIISVCTQPPVPGHRGSLIMLPPETPPELPPESTSDTQHARSGDLQCAKCGSELQGVPGDGRCPHCDVSVALSAEGHKTRLSVLLRVCRSCGYRLLGLPDEGRCPECGQAYTRETLIRRYVGYLEDSWLQIFQVPLAALFGSSACQLLFRHGHASSSIVVLIVMAIGCTAWAWHLSVRMAAWHYLAKLEATASGRGREVPASYKLKLTCVLFGFQIALIVVPWLGPLNAILGAP
jgi:predicted Zn-ribbon and HTH transcriptional regulator